nr:hypothetical protein [uncultured Desulfobulbus sp.]
MLGDKKDKVSDVVNVLKVIKHEWEKVGNRYSISDIRIDSVKVIADVEYNLGRYKNIKSAYHTIHDALARRLKPDIPNIAAFDTLTEKWLRDNSLELKQILLGYAQDREQRSIIEQLFFH